MTKKEIYNELLVIRTHIRTEDNERGEKSISALMDKLFFDMEEERVQSRDRGSLGGQMVRKMIMNAERSRF